MRQFIGIYLFVLVSGMNLATAVAGADDSPFPELTGPYFGQKPPGVIPEPFADGILNPPDGYHSSIVFSPDGKEAYWTGMSKNTYYSRLERGVWTEPGLSSIDPEYGIGEPMYSHDGSRLYFLSRRLPVIGAVDRERIWYVELPISNKTEPQLIDSVVAEIPTHWQFSLSSNGSLYFTSEKRGVAGPSDIYIARWNGTNFSDPVNPGSNVNSEVRDFCPFVAPDESYLIFARSVPEENNRSDLFISFRGSDGQWLEAVNMGDTINSLHNEVCPVVTPDGKYLFFCRVSSGENKLYWVSSEVIEKLRKN